jgi:large subunit ribosomal protein L9
MRVVFLNDVEGVALAGEIKNVADGYARNFLLPRQLAAAANTSTVQQAEKRARLLAKEQEKIDETARGVATTLSASPIVITARVGEQGRLFGSVTATDIAEAVNAHGASGIGHRQVVLKTPIKDVGTYEIPVSLTRNVVATVSVQVAPEGGVIPEVPAATTAVLDDEEDLKDDDEDVEDDEVDGEDEET